MATTVSQTYYSEQLNTDESKVRQKYTSGDIEYIVRGADDEEAAIIAVRDAVSTKHLGMRLTSISISERLDDDSWRVRCSYDATVATSDDDGVSKPDYTVNFDFSSTTKHISHSKRTTSKYSADPEKPIAPDYEQAINYNDGRIEGVDIISPQMEFSETHYFYNSELTTKYRKTLATMIGRVNNDTFRGYSAGEVLFLGVSGSRAGQDPDDLWTLTFKFAVSPNEEGLTAGDIIGISKKGWEYSWQHMADVVDTVNNVTKKIPMYAYVEQVYDVDDFKKLGIGV
ncbi:MAG: hypothetical protein WCR17_04545 [Candidatus Methanomethylophilaceae archaeon]